MRGLAIAALALPAVPGLAAAHGREHGRLAKIDRFVVIYQENHSFDNLYGSWESVDGLGRADAAHTTQVDQAGARYACLPQNDVNIAPACPPNAPFLIEQFIPPSASTCPNGVRDPTGLPGGCTRDLVHRFYQEQYQLNGGQQNRYTTGSDALGLTQGVYDTRKLPIYSYLHHGRHPRYAISDAFFQSAFGGSFLNHQWLVAARTPFWPGAPTTGPDNLHSITDTNGMPVNYPFYKATGPVADSSLTEGCPSTPAQHDNPPRDPAHANSVCGDWAVNTTQPLSQPYSPGTALARRLPPQSSPTIGDRLTAAGRSWAWYAGGWSNADGRVGDPGWTNGTGPVTRGSNANGCPDPNAKASATWPFCPDNLFQFHHQPLNYY